MDIYNIISGIKYRPFLINDEVIFYPETNPYFSQYFPEFSEEYVLTGVSGNKDGDNGDYEVNPDEYVSPYILYGNTETSNQSSSSESGASETKPVIETVINDEPVVEYVPIPIEEIPHQKPLTLPSNSDLRRVTQPIIDQIASTAMGKHILKYDNIDVGHMQPLLDEAAKYGISFRITSGLRPGATTSSGKTSYHATGHAIDVTPVPGETYEMLKEKIRNNPAFVKWMQEHGYGIYEENTPEVMAKTGATGAHWHIGKDRVAIKGLQEIIS